MTYEREYILPQILEEACDQNQLQVDEAGTTLYVRRACVNSATCVQGRVLAGANAAQRSTHAGL